MFVIVPVISDVFVPTPSIFISPCYDVRAQLLLTWSSWMLIRQLVAVVTLLAMVMLVSWRA